MDLDTTEITVKENCLPLNLTLSFVLLAFDKPDFLRRRKERFHQFFSCFDMYVKFKVWSAKLSRQNILNL